VNKSLSVVRPNPPVLQNIPMTKRTLQSKLYKQDLFSVIRKEMFTNKEIQAIPKDSVEALYNNSDVVAAIKINKKFDASKNMSIRKYLEGKKTEINFGDRYADN